MHCARVLALIVLLVGLVHSFSWDIVVAGNKQLEFLHHGTLTHTELIPSANKITSVTYDQVHYRLLFTDYNSSTVSIYSYDLSTRNIQVLVTRRSNDDSPRVVYDPVTQAVYWIDYYSIYSSSLNPASSNKADGNLLAKLDHFCYDLAVDSCGGYIYWITDEKIERARLDGSEREVLITGTVWLRLSLAIDQQTQAIYWTQKTHSGDLHWSIERANFNGKNRTTLYIVRNTLFAFSLAVSKDFIYWQNNGEEGIWQLPKNKTSTATKLHSISSSNCGSCNRVATNYTIEEQIEGVKSCHALQALIPRDCTVSICQNYCFQGECSVSAEGPTCSCKAGYSGERCDLVNACHDYCLHGGVCSLNEENKRVCQCTAGYDGERCDVSICNEYCLQGNCSVGADGLPKCSCKAGFSGERCDVNACHKHCLNGGVCSLNKGVEPVCQCTAGYGGGRCENSICNEYCLQGDCSVGADGLPKCSCNAGYSGERCEVNACHDYCLHGGVCSLNKGVEPVCECTAGYGGARCENSICNEYCLEGDCVIGADGLPKCSCTPGYSGDRCEVNACHNRCSNNAICYLNEEDEPACECTADYEGERCDIAITQTGDRADNTTQQVLRDLRSQVSQVIKEELKRILHFSADKLDEYEAKI